MTEEMREVTEEQYANLPPLTKSTAEIKTELGEHRERDYKLQTRWILGLAVANGGALTALSAKILDAIATKPTPEARAAFALAYPSLWFFVIGFTAVGCIAVSELLSNHTMIRKAHRSLRFRAHNPGAVTIDEIPPITIKAWAFEAISALSFIGGLTYPLTVLAIRYWREGGFTW